MSKNGSVIGALALLSPAEALDEVSFLAEVKAEAIGWQPLEEGAYLHVSQSDEDDPIITVVGTPDASLAGTNVLLLY